MPGGIALGEFKSEIAARVFNDQRFGLVILVFQERENLLERARQAILFIVGGDDDG